MESHLTKVLMKLKQGRLYLEVALLQAMIRPGDVLTAMPESSKENSEPSPEPLKAWSPEISSWDIFILFEE